MRWPWSHYVIIWISQYQIYTIHLLFLPHRCVWGHCFRFVSNTEPRCLSNSWMPFLESLSKTHFIHDLPFLQWVISAFSLQCYNLLSALLVRQVVIKHTQILPLTPSHLLYNLRSTTFNLKASQRVRFAVCSNSFCIRLIYFVKWVT